MEAAKEHAYMSIAINADGAPVSRGFVPWERTVSAFNMKTPKITLAASDLQDETIRNALRSCDLCGCYLFTALSDYSFLSEFSGLLDLFITHGEQIHDLSFVRDMKNLYLFYLEDAKLPDLKPLIEVCNEGERLPGKCLGFYHCEVEDTSALSDVDFIISELLVWPSGGDTRDRWKTSTHPGTFRFYEK
jgi:hypothetical protein